MNKKHDKVFEQFLKAASIDFSYKPGPLMEEKIIKRIKRQKYLSRFYKISIGVVIVLIALFIGGQELGLEKMKNLFSLVALFENSFPKNGKEVNFKLQTDPAMKNFTVNLNEFGFTDNQVSEKKALNEASEVTEANDNIFKMIRYVSIASDDGW